MGKIFAVGDIHGCTIKLEKLISGIAIDDQDDTVVFLGDYIDRGQDSRGVVEFIINFQKGKNNVFCLTGNHEELFMNYLKYGNDINTFYSNGGHSTLLSYSFPRLIDDIPESHQKYFASLLPYYETESYIFVHAGLKPHVPFNRQELNDMLWIRDEFINSSCDFGKTVVFGHTPFPRPLIDINKIGIDTGAVYGGKLTCVELPEKKIYQA
jgi:serine/threonine protein phosphatase 1